uniref:Uncharacterized protein n=1 Tax=Aegilops tauschii subsp. strangulata TaxID=200361 RepID=A0A453JEY1_AEGTS
VSLTGTTGTSASRGVKNSDKKDSACSACCRNKGKKAVHSTLVQYI